MNYRIFVLPLIMTLCIGHALAEQENQTSYRLSRELTSNEVEITRLEKAKSYILNIEKTLAEFEDVLSGIKYEFDISLINNLPTLAENVSKTVESSKKLDLLNQLHSRLVDIRFSNMALLQPIRQQLSLQTRYDPTNEFERAELKRFQKFSDEIENKLDTDFYKKTSDVLPEILYYDQNYNVDDQKTIREAVKLKEKINQAILLELKNLASENTFNELKTIYSNALVEFKSEIQNEKNKLETEIETLSEKSESLNEQLESKEERQSKIDQSLVWTLPVYGILILAMLMIPRLYKGNEQVQAQIFKSGLILELITVYLLTATILLLGISGKIENEVLGTLIAGISGYVLGRATQSNTSTKET